MGRSWCFPNFPALLSASPFTLPVTLGCCTSISLPTGIFNTPFPAAVGADPLCRVPAWSSTPCPRSRPGPGSGGCHGVSIQAGISVVFGPSAALREPGTCSRAHSSAPGRRLESLLSRALQRESSHPSRSPAAPREPPAPLQPQQSDRHQPSF